MSFKMKYEITKQYITSGSKRRSGIKMPKIGFMTAHDTGNPGSTAKGNCTYYQNSRNEMSASAHIFVDDKSIIECIPFLTATAEKAWHVLYNVTTDNIMYGGDANDIAGGVELCYGGKINPAEAYKRYIWVLAYACYKYKLNPAKAIVGHHILDPKRKSDPASGLKKMGPSYSYAKLLEDVVTEYNECTGNVTVNIQAPATKPGQIGIGTILVDELNVRGGASLTAPIVKETVKGKLINKVLKKGSAWKIYKKENNMYNVGGNQWISAGNKYVSFKEV